MYPLNVHEWRICPVIEHTYANVKLAFTAAQVRTRSDRARIPKPVANILQQVEDASARLTDAASTDCAQALKAWEENARLIASINQLHICNKLMNTLLQTNNVQGYTPPQQLHPMHVNPQFPQSKLSSTALQTWRTPIESGFIGRFHGGPITPTNPPGAPVQPT
jgi:hypothetical protein